MSRLTWFMSSTISSFFFMISVDELLLTSPLGETEALLFFCALWRSNDYSCDGSDKSFIKNGCD